MWRSFFCLLVSGVALVGAQTCRDTDPNCFAQELNLTLPGFATISATRTCGLPQPRGEGSEQFSFGGLTTSTTQTGPFTCDTNPGTSHPVEFIADENPNTWWQSPFLDRNVSLQLDFPNPIFFVLTEMEFRSVRPVRVRLDYSTNNGVTWRTYQFYSDRCNGPINLFSGWNLPRTRTSALPMNNEAVCIEDQSRPSPENRGTITFVPYPRLGDRIYSDISLINTYLVITNLRVEFSYLYSAFGVPATRADFGADRYYYGVYRWTVRARCHCWGHSNDCAPAAGDTGSVETGCVCMHNTEGRHCELCQPLFNNRPWAPGNDTNANACEACVCNNHASRCTYNAARGRGVCDACAHNTQGDNCDTCVLGTFRTPNVAIDQINACSVCNCDSRGIVEGTTCDQTTGNCQCKTNVQGARCDQCKAGYFDLQQSNVPHGCSPCNCNPIGSVSTTCDRTTGDCTCKANIATATPGVRQLCDRCAAGSFSLSALAPDGCWRCICSGHSTTCSALSGYRLDRTRYSTIFSDATQLHGWALDSQTASETLNLITDTAFSPPFALAATTQASTTDRYFQAPAQFLGDKRLSLGHYLEYDIRAEPTFPPGTQLTRNDRLEGDIRIIGEFNRVIVYEDTDITTATSVRKVRVKLYRGPWRIASINGAVASEQYIFAVLHSVQGLFIRARYYSSQAQTSLANIVMETATLSSNTALTAVSSVENCVCPAAYAGRDCSSCATPLSRRLNAGVNDPLSTCVGCECNNHASSCDQTSGVCIQCRDNTEGNNCERCRLGYFGSATGGTTNDCRPCPCPGTSGQTQFTQTCRVGAGIDGSQCLNCPTGHIGLNCERCADGFSGTPTIPGRTASCSDCTCNCNIDRSAAGNCNTTTGECLRCTRNTAGSQCERCADHYFGRAHDGCTTPSNCAACSCNSCGIIPSTICDGSSGQCRCAPNVSGRQCDRCDANHYGLCLNPGTGCRPCDCHPQGSTSPSCNTGNGQCSCRTNVINRNCNECRNTTFGLASGQGCSACQCHVPGTEAHACATGASDCTCNKVTGQCPCVTNVVGRTCSQCRFGSFGTPPNCVECHQCFLDWFAIIQRLAIEVGAADNETLQALERAFGGLSATEITDLLNRIKAKLDNVTIQLGRRRDLNIAAQMNTLETSFTTQQQLLQTMNRLVDDAQSALNSIEIRLPVIMAFNSTVSVNNGSGSATAVGLAAARQALNAQVDTLRTNFESEQALVGARRQQAESASQLANSSQNTVAAAVTRAQTAASIINEAQDNSDNASQVSTDNQNSINNLDPLIRAEEEKAANASRLLTQARALLSSANTTALQAYRAAHQRMAEAQTLLMNVTELSEEVAATNATSSAAHTATRASLVSVQQLRRRTEGVIDLLNPIPASLVIVVEDLAEAERLANHVLNLTLPDEAEVRRLAADINATILPQAEVDAVVADAQRSLTSARQTLALAQQAHTTSQQALDLVTLIEANLQTVDSNRATVQANLNRVRMYIIQANASVSEALRLGGEITAAAGRVNANIQSGYGRATALEACQNTTADTVARAESHIGATCTVTAPQALMNTNVATQTVNTVNAAAEARLLSSQRVLSDAQQVNATANALGAQLASATSLADLQALLVQYTQLQMDIQSAQTRVDTQHATLTTLIYDLNVLIARCPS